MKKLSILLAIFLLISEAAIAEGIPVRVRSDGYVINEDGRILAVPNKSDSRNTADTKYYTSLGADGKPLPKSDFYLTADPEKGYLRHAAQDAAPANNGMISSQSNGIMQPNGVMQNTGVTNYGTGQVLIKNPDAPIYNNYVTPRTVY